MKNLKWLFISCMAIAAAGVGVAVAVQKPSRNSDVQAVAAETQRFHVRGQVRSIDTESKEIRIKHEEIPNYMAAMTMPFAVRDDGLLRGLKNGDEIGFELLVTKDDSWIASIQRLSEATAATGLDNPELGAKDIQRVQVGERVPDLALTDQNGRGMRLRDFRGKA